MVLGWVFPLVRRIVGDAVRAVSAGIDAGSRGNARAEVTDGAAHGDRRTAPWLTVCPDVPAGTADPPQEGAGS